MENAISFDSLDDAAAFVGALSRYVNSPPGPERSICEMSGAARTPMCHALPCVTSTSISRPKPASPKARHVSKRSVVSTADRCAVPRDEAHSHLHQRRVLGSVRAPSLDVQARNIPCRCSSLPSRSGEVTRDKAMQVNRRTGTLPSNRVRTHLIDRNTPFKSTRSS